ACYGSGKGEIGERPGAGNGVFFRNSAVGISDIPDGTSTTLAIGERAALFARSPWAGAINGGTIRNTPDAPVNYADMEEDPVELLAGITNYLPPNDPLTTLYGFFSPHQRLIQFVFADGAVHPIYATIQPPVYQALATRAGHEVISGEDF